MICFNFASRSRPQKFFDCLENIRSFISTKDYFVLAKIDEDQKQSYDRVNNYPEVKVCYGLSLNKVHAINRGLENVKFDILCNHSDDMFFTRNGFDELIREHCGPDTFLHIPDQVVGDKISTYSIMGFDYYNRFKYVYNP